MKTKTILLSVIIMLGMNVRADHGPGPGGPIIVEPGEDPIIIPIEEDPLILPVERVRLHCSSSRYRYQECLVNGRVLEVQLIQQLSQARCQRGRTFGIAGGVAGRGIFVDRGCRGVFRVTYVDGMHGDHDHGMGDGDVDGGRGLEFLELQ